MQKRRFRIGELADKLMVEKFVIRFWEKEFAIKTKRSEGLQRFYDEDDLKKFAYIKKLLYEDGFTISGAKKKLKEPTEGKVSSVIASKKTTIENFNSSSSSVHSISDSEKNEKIEYLSQQIVDLKNKLRKLREIL